MVGPTFILSDESLNEYGFRVKTDGIELEHFRKNPVMLWNHRRDNAFKEDAVLPIGKWVNLRVDNGKLLAEPAFDDDDEFAMKIAGKVKKGIINSTSVNLKPVELSDDPKDLLQGQRRPTLTRSRLKEVSMTDIPGNANAVRLTDENGDTIELNGEADQDKLDSIIPKIKQQGNMKQILLKLGLTEDASEAEALIKLQAKLDKITETEQEIQRLQTENEQLKGSAAKDKAIALVDGAVASGKVLAGSKDHFVKLAEADYDSAKAIIDGLPGKPADLNGQAKAAAPKDVKKLSDMADDPDAVVKLREDNPAEYSRLYKAEYGYEPNLED